MSSPEESHIADQEWFRRTGGRSANPEGEERINPVPPTAAQVKAAEEMLELMSRPDDEPLF